MLSSFGRHCAIIEMFIVACFLFELRSSSIELKNSELPDVIKKLEGVMVQRKQKIAELRKADDGDRTRDTQAIDRALDDLEVGSEGTGVDVGG